MPLSDFVTNWDHLEVIKTPDSSIVKRNVTFLDKNQPTVPKNRYSVAILGVPDLPDEGVYQCATRVRECLYMLVEISNGLPMIDLGNIKYGGNLNETCINISRVIIEMTKLKINVILLGGSSKYHVGCILASQKCNIPVNMVSIDAEINPELFVPSYMNEFMEVDDLSAMYNFTNIGYQSYLVERK